MKKKNAEKMPMNRGVGFGDYQVLQLDSLIHYQKNARTHSPEQVKQIAASIKKFGFTNPVLVDEDFNIIAGHGRSLAAKELGMKNVPAIILKGLSPDEKKALILADNKLALNAGWDNALLAEELQSLLDGNFDVSVIGFDDKELERLLAVSTVGETDPDDMPEMPEDPITVYGDVWLLGSHRVICGDATIWNHVEKLMGGAMADCLWTDPPYNVNYEGSAGKIKNDNMGDVAFLTFLCDSFTCAYSALKPGGAAYVAHADTEGFNFRNAFKSAGFKLASCLIWRKNSLVLGRSDYQWQHEPILYGWKPGAAHRWFGGRNKTTMVEMVKESPAFNKLEKNVYQVNLGERSIIIHGSNVEIYDADPSVISEEKPKRSSEHPTMKPVALIERFLENSTLKADLVLDLFGGSGSTLIACEKNGRICYMSELDPKYVDVIVDRWQKFTGKTALLEGTGERFGELKMEKKDGKTK